MFPEIAKDYSKDNILPVDQVSAGSHTKVRWICPKCNKEYFASPHHRTSKDKTECPYCAKQSKGEREITAILNQYQIRYKTQCSFDDLRGDSGRPLKFDFALYQDDRLVGVIEFNGEQHYKNIDFFGGQEAREKQRKNDFKKTVYCINKMIPILLIAKQSTATYMSTEEQVTTFLKNLNLI